MRFSVDEFTTKDNAFLSLVEYKETNKSKGVLLVTSYHPVRKNIITAYILKNDIFILILANKE